MSKSFQIWMNESLSLMVNSTFLKSFINCRKLLPLLSNLEATSYILWEQHHLDGPCMCLGPNHWNRLVELQVGTLISDVPCSLWPHFMCFKLQDLPAARSPTELSVGEGGLHSQSWYQGKGEYPRDSADVLNSAISSWIFSIFFLLALCLPLSIWYIPHEHLSLRLLTQSESCGFERSIILWL